MQWLIDLVIEAIGIPPVFIDRGDPIAYDYDTDDLTKDNAWHNLDLSAIVPENAKGVALSIIAMDGFVGVIASFRKNGNTNLANISQIRTQIAFETITADMVVPCDENRIIEYRTSASPWLIFYITVKGWWL